MGHTLVLGATGSGKSFLLNFLLVQALKYDPQVLVLDLGRSYRYLTEFVGGRYLALAEGEELDPSSAAQMGLQPFGLPSSVRTRQFLVAWLQRLLAIGQYACEADDLSDLDKRVDEVFRRAPEKRTLSALAHLLPRRMWPAMSRWVDEGTWAPWFDGPPAGLKEFGRWQVVDLAARRSIPTGARPPCGSFSSGCGCDGRRVAAGRLKVLVVDEAWRYLRDPVDTEKLVEAARTWRKMNGVLIVATQSAADVLNAAPELLESMPTRLLLANPSFPDRGRPGAGPDPGRDGHGARARAEAGAVHPSA